jgi:hypothetical protein
LNIYDKAQKLKNEWETKEKENGYETFSTIPANTEMIKQIKEEIEKDMDRIIFNVLEGKGSRIDGKKILEKIRESYIQ